MEILPIESLSETDKTVFGINLYNLSVLKRLDFPVLPGIVVSPPEIILQTVLKFIQEGSREIFEQKLTIIKNEVAKISIPDDLKSKLSDKESYLLGEKLYKSKSELWSSLLEIWLDEIRDKIWNMGFSSGICGYLSSQAVFFITGNFESGEAFFDPESDQVIINFAEKLPPFFLNKIDQTVIKGNKKLFIPQIYQLIKTEEGINLIAVYPFTESLPGSSKEDIFIPRLNQRKVIKSAVKLLLNLSNGFAINPNIDGLLISGEDSTDFDQLVFRICEGALAYPGKPVIYKLEDKDDGELSGALRLLHRKSDLDLAAEALLFARNKKNLLNVELAIPKLNSVEEFMEIKQELNSRGISRKGTLKIWLEMSVPENIINIEKYLEIGIDGIMLNFDYLQKLLIDNMGNMPDLAKNNAQTIIKFLEPLFKILHQKKIPVIGRGALILHPDVLDFLIEKGVFGIVANTISETENLPEHLSWVEKRLVQKML